MSRFAHIIILNIKDYLLMLTTNFENIRSKTKNRNAYISKFAYIIIRNIKDTRGWLQ